MLRNFICFVMSILLLSLHLVTYRKFPHDVNKRLRPCNLDNSSCINFTMLPEMPTNSSLYG